LITIDHTCCLVDPRFRKVGNEASSCPLCKTSLCGARGRGLIKQHTQSTSKLLTPPTRQSKKRLRDEHSYASQYLFTRTFENPRFNLMVGTVFLYESQGNALLGMTENRSEKECGQHIAALRRATSA
jgi:hypothetical protein